MVDINQTKGEASDLLKRAGVERNTSPSGRGVYILWSKRAQMFKIGKTTDLKRRMRSLNGMIPEEIELVGFIKNDAITFIEGSIHKLFAEYRTKGEWFRLNPNELLGLHGIAGYTQVNVPLSEYVK